MKEGEQAHKNMRQTVLRKRKAPLNNRLEQIRCRAHSDLRHL